MTRSHALACAFLAAVLTAPGCTLPGNGSPQAPPVGRDAPQDAAPGTCWDKTTTPAVIETVTETLLVQPAQVSSSGTVQSPPVYRSVARPRIVTPRRETWFEMPCPADLTPDFLASVRRALSARGYEVGAPGAVLDPQTEAGLARYQTDQAIAAPRPGALTVETARQLGLWAVPREALDGG